MKKKALTLLLFTILTINFIGATIECSTIADIRKQTSGTSVKYTGTATTTFYGLGGILIKDTTGCLYVKNAPTISTAIDVQIIIIFFINPIIKKGIQMYPLIFHVVIKNRLFN